MPLSTDHRVGAPGASLPSALPLSSNSSTHFTLMREAPEEETASCLRGREQGRRARAPPPAESALYADFVWGAVVGALPPQSSASVTAVSSMRTGAVFAGGGGVDHLGPTAGAGPGGASCSALAFVHPASTARVNNSP